MNRAALALAGLVIPGAVGSVFLTTAAVRPKAVDLAGTPWYSDVSDATKIAEREKKPLLVLQMMGKLDDAFC